MSDANEWKTYDELICGAATNRLPSTDVLVGETPDVASQHGPGIDLIFEVADRVRWTSGGTCDLPGTSWGSPPMAASPTSRREP